jgi:hypothetical protein
MKNALLEAAIKYLDMGYSVIPLRPGDKRPMIKWEPFQKERPTRQMLVSWWSREPKANVGIVTGRVSDLCVIDCDTPEAYGMVSEIMGDQSAPTTRTPRGGNHVLCSYEDGVTIGSDPEQKIDWRGEGGYIVAPPSVRSDGAAYEWITPLDAAAKPKLFIYIIKKLNIRIDQSNYADPTKTATATNNHNSHKQPQLFIEGRRDNDLFHVANCLKLGGCEDHYIRQTLELLGSACNPPFDPREINTKIESAIKRQATRERNIAAEVREWVSATNGHFSATDCHKELDFSTNGHKKAINEALRRMCADGKIERIGEKNGVYRRVDEHSDDEMVFIETALHEFPVHLPFGLSALCKIYPGNIIIVAGSKSAGKTALLLNIAKSNSKDGTPVLYMNSEMENEEFTDRMRDMGYVRASDIGFKMIKRHTNFHDRITQDKKIFIIDFLEIHDNFYEIAKYIRAIHEKLKNGIAIAAVQKKAGAMLARGSDFSAEKARLYLSMDYDQQMRATKLTIYDAKIPRNPELGSLKGKWKHIKIVNTKMTALSEAWNG